MASASKDAYVPKTGPRSGRSQYRGYANPPIVGGKVETRSGFPTRAAALAWARQHEADLAAGHAQALLPRVPTVEEWWTRVQAEDLWPLSEKAVTSRDDDMRVYVLPKWGAMPLDAVRTPDVTAWLRRLCGEWLPGDRLPPSPGRPQSLKDSTHAKATLSRLFSLAVEADILDVNRVSAAKAPKRGTRIPRFLLMDEVRQALPHLPEWLRAPVQVLALTGVRLGELRGLDEHSWQPGRDRLTIDRVVVQAAHKDFAWRSVPKGLRFRHVPVVPEVAALIAAHAAAHPPARQHVRGAVDGGRPGPNATPALWFTMPDGSPLLEGDILKAWTSAQSAAALPRRATVHGLRHSYASHLLTEGTPLGTLAALMGHSATRTTELYAWITDLDSAAVRAILSDAATSFLPDNEE